MLQKSNNIVSVNSKRLWIVESLFADGKTFS